MKTKRFWIVFHSSLLVVILGTANEIKAQKTDLSRIPTQVITLLSFVKHKDSAKASFDFARGVGGNSESPDRRYSSDLRYGGISENGDDHWLEVTMGGGSRRQLKDLGEMNWSDIHSVPVLLASPMPLSGTVAWSYKAGKVFEISPEGVNIRAVMHHMYVMHVKDDDSDANFYVMFRIESIVEMEGECTITWKRVPSPEGN